MQKVLLSSLITLSALLPQVALACVPQNPYFYMVKGAYLLAFLGLVLALVLELFRFAVAVPVTRQILRRGAFFFGLFAITMLLVACVYTDLKQSWETDYGTVPAGASSQRC